MVRGLFKSGLYTHIVASDAQKSIDLLQRAYTLLKSISQSTPEIRDNADLIAVFICKLMLNANQTQTFLTFFRDHFQAFLGPLTLWQNNRWAANWFNLAGTMLETYFQQR